MTPDGRYLRVFVDDTALEIAKGTTLAEALSHSNSYHDSGAIVAVGVRTSSIKTNTLRFVLNTSNGDIILEFDRKRRGGASLAKSLSEASLGIQFTDANSVSIGSFQTDQKAKYGEYELEEGDICFDLAGMDSRNACLIMSKRKHRGLFTAVGTRTVGRIVGGERVLHDLKMTDRVFSVHPVSTSATGEEKAFCKTNDLNMRIESDGTRIYSHVEAKMLDGTPDSGELLVNAMARGIMKIGSSTGSFLSNDAITGVRIKESNPGQRRRGSITVRNSGSGQGRAYFYKKPRPPLDSHTVVGEVSSGMELLDLAGEGDLVFINLVPKRINVVGRTQSSAQDYLRGQCIEQVRLGKRDDEAVIVRMTPSTSLEILQTKKVETMGVDRERIIKIRLFEDNAPTSVRFFKAVSGLMFDPVGSLRILYPYSPLIGAVLMAGDLTRVVSPSLPPENTPTDAANRGDIGLTNSVKTRMGTIGVRMIDSREFGPSCESFDSTNLVGRVERDSIPILEKTKEGEEVFLILGE